jgi:hypothetical protein
MLKTAPSTMKNPPTGCDRVLRFRVQDWKKVEKPGKTDELLKKLALLDISQTNREDLKARPLGEELLKAIDDATP